MNLASQSVLEGLNACLDHRSEVRTWTPTTSLRSTWAGVSGVHLGLTAGVHSSAGYGIHCVKGDKDICLPEPCCTGRW